MTLSGMLLYFIIVDYCWTAQRPVIVKELESKYIKIVKEYSQFWILTLLQVYLGLNKVKVKYN